MGISFWISLILLWILFYVCYQGYCLDYVREKLFAIRDELFDIMLQHELEFDHPAYGILRSRINHSIQFTHKLTAIHLVLIYLFATWKTRPGRAFEERVQAYSDALETLPNEIQEKFVSIEVRVLVQLLIYVVFTSALFWLSILPVAAYLFFRRLCLNLVKRLASTARFSGWLERIDEAERMSSSMMPG